MSQENVERVRKGFEAHNRGDLDALVEFYDPDVVFETLLLGTHHGNEAIRLIFEENQKTLSGYDVMPVELIDGGDKVVAVAQTVGSGPVSQIAVEDQFAFGVHVRGGAVRAGAGIPQQRGSPRSRRAVGVAEKLCFGP
jgi:ketosteroid isomerase-like protein